MCAEIVAGSEVFVDRDHDLRDVGVGVGTGERVCIVEATGENSGVGIGIVT